VSADFQPTLALEMLRAHGVGFICIGGTAAVMHGANYVTFDLDVCPDEDADNLERLSRALTALHARVRVEGVDDGFVFAHDGASLARARMWNLMTDAGDLDICFVPAGTAGYDDLARNAVAMDLDGHTILVASLDDIIRSKRAANRDKDRLALPILEEIRDRLS
jgi:hypothetical protein